uniref:Uncharacterized protein n=1 Tax=Botrytis cinerea binarnavirus 3 TaxID=2802528 RepID=A0A8A8Q6M2_9VIRU|nr:hypothetical protein [Botrytis cinerea binarnavirus 3]
MNLNPLQTDIPYDDMGGAVWNPLDFLPKREETMVHGDVSVFQDIARDSFEICTKYDIEGVTPIQGKAVGMEVGDDRVDTSRSAPTLGRVLSVQERVMGMRTSWEDTVISKRIHNFCEVTNSLPTDPNGSFDICRRIGDFSKLEYTDAVILRIIIDCSKGEASHSSTAVGKAGMLASRCNTPRSEHRSSLHLASYIQDGCLRTAYSADPKYLPGIMGGSGHRALFDSPTNLYLSVKAYRGGGYDRLYGSATKEIRQCIDQLDDGKGATPVLSLRLRDRQEYLHGTYADKILVPSKTLQSFGQVPLPEPLYKATGAQNRFQSTEARLVRTKHLIGRKDAEREVEKTHRTQHALFGTTDTMHVTRKAALQRRLARKKFSNALQGNTAFMRLLNRCANGHEVETLQKEGFLSLDCGVTAFTKWDADWLFAGGKGETHSIDSLTSTEDMFLRAEVSTEESFRIGNIPLRVLTSGKARYETTKSKVGLYQINDSMVEWADHIVERLIEEREKWKTPLHPSVLNSVFNENREWVNDDTLLIAQCLIDVQGLTKAAYVCLISDDRRLGNQMANTCNVNVIRISPRSVILKIPRERWTSDTVVTMAEASALLMQTHYAGSKLSGVYLDTGSVASACAKYSDTDSSPGKRVFKFRETISTGYNVHGQRYNQYLLRTEEVEVPLLYECHTNVYRGRRYKWQKPLENVYSGKGSWRKPTVDFAQ